MSSPGSTPIIFCAPFAKALIDELRSIYIMEAGISVYADVKAAEIVPLVSPDTKTVIVFGLDQAGQIEEIAGICKQLKKLIDDGIVAIVVVLKINNPKLGPALRQIGCSDLVDFPLSAKALKVRIDRQIGRVARAFALIASNRPRPAASTALAEGDDPSVIDEFAPLDHPADFWILYRLKEIRRVGGRWVIPLIGPDPSTGHWLKSEENSAQNSDAWEWSPSETAKASTAKGHWVFFGKRPDFLNGRWLMTSAVPKLVFFNQLGVVAATRCFIKANGGLAIAQNSKDAVWPSSPAAEPFEWDEEADRVIQGLVGTDTGMTPGHSKAAQVFAGAKLPDEKREFFQKSAERLLGTNQSFEPIGDAESRKNLVREAAKDRGTVTVWNRHQKWRGDLEIARYDIATGRLSLKYPDGISKEQFLEVLQSTPEMRIYFNINLRRAAVFFIALTKEIDFAIAFFSVNAPATMYQIQRRGAFRYMIPAEKKLKVWINEKRYPVLNVSSGGMALVASLKEAAQFERLSKIPKLSLDINRQKIECPGEVRWTREVIQGPMQGLHVGLQFEGLSEAIVQMINLYVFEESVPYLEANVVNEPSK